MNSGDKILVHMHDTPAGFQVNLVDRAALVGRQIEREAVLEVADANFNCTQPGFQDAGSGIDGDDLACFPGGDSTLVMIDGCEAVPDEDFDGQPYQLDWPGTNPNPIVDRQLHPTSELFTSPVTGSGRNYSTIAFETDVPDLENDINQQGGTPCNQQTGAGCVVPPDGAAFYPFFTTTVRDGTCTWQEGGNFIPGTINHFGGSAQAEFGPLLREDFRVPSANGPTIFTAFEDFNSGNLRNACPVAPVFGR